MFFSHLFNNNTNDTEVCAFGFFDDGICYVRLSREKEGFPHVEELEFLAGEPGLHPLLLKQLVKSNGLNKIKCNTYLTHDNYQLLTTEKPDVPDADLINALQWEVKDLIALPVGDATLDTFMAPNEATGVKSINVVSAEKQKIVDIANLFKDAKLNLNAIDIEELTLRNLAILDEHEKHGIVTLWLAADHGKVLFIHDENMHLSRNIEYGYNSILAAQGGMESIALEVQRSIDYFERHYNQVPIQSLLLMPIGIKTGVFSDFLNKNLSLSCHELELENRITGLENIEPEKLTKFLLTIGASLRQEKGKSNATS